MRCQFSAGLRFDHRVGIQGIAVRSGVDAGVENVQAQLGEHAGAATEQIVLVAGVYKHGGAAVLEALHQHQRQLLFTGVEDFRQMPGQFLR